MPLFEYRCETCEHLEEVLQKHGDPAPALCPACGAEGEMCKEISRTSFQLKGGGWYKDLYASVPAGKKDAEGGESPQKSEKKGEKKAGESGGESKQGASGGEKKPATSPAQF